MEDRHYESVLSEISLLKLRDKELNISKLSLDGKIIKSDKYHYLKVGKKIVKFPKLKNKVEVVDLSWNDISEIPKLPDNTHSLFMLYNRLEDVNDVFGNLVTINLSGNKISRFEFVPEKCETLMISNNNLEEFPILTGKIKKLDISGNNIVNVPITDMYDKERLPKLEILWMSNNNIRKLPWNMICQNSLIDIQGGHNNIEIWESRFYTQLRDLELEHNKIKEIPCLFEGIDYLDLSSNKLIKLEKEDLPKSIKILGIRNNKNMEHDLYKNDYEYL